MQDPTPDSHDIFDLIRKMEHHSEELGHSARGLLWAVRLNREFDLENEENANIVREEACRRLADSSDLRDLARRLRLREEGGAAGSHPPIPIPDY